MNNNNKQSINNYVYNRRRNREPEPVRNENDFDFTNQNNDTRQNSSSSMYNSYVSENNYNSYTSGYQTNSYNNYSQPPQNNYNNNFNNYSQPLQNNYNGNFNNYNQPQNNQSVWQTDFGEVNRNRNRPINRREDYRAITGHDVTEIPLRDKMPLSTVIALTSFMITFVLMILLGILSSIFHWSGDGLMIVMLVSFFIGFFGMAFSTVFGSNIDRHQNLKVCKTLVKGRLVGYEERRRSHKGHRYYVYAPKYEIFVNNRYEIRTVSIFERGHRNWGNEINLLVNPDGYEAIPATKADFPKRSAGEWIGALIVGIFIIVFFLGPLILSLMNSR